MADISQKRENSKGDARGMNPNSQKNLKPFLNGRPKKEVCVTSWLKEYASSKITNPIEAKNLTFAQAAALQTWKAAAKGDLESYEFIINRIEGKLPLKVDSDIKITQNMKELTDEQLIEIINEGSSQGVIESTDKAPQ
jgi:hypothetical protein